MTARRKILLLATAFSPVLLIGASCSFPDVSFSPAGGTPESGTSDSPTGSDGPVTGDAAKVGANEDVDPTGSAMDATTVPEGGGQIEAGPAGCCDCDNDQVKADGGACAKTSGDCDDLNPFIKPGQDFVNTQQWPSQHTPAYDWDCSGVVVKQYNYGLAPCAAQAKLSGCGNFQGGYQDNPACGAPGHYTSSCVADTNALNLTCTEAASDSRPQGCH